MAKTFNILILTLFLLVLSQFSYAQEEYPYDRILSNSEDWRDVYSTMMYGNLVSKPANFIVSDRHATLILNSIGRGASVQAVSSNRVPFVVGYRNLLQSRGYDADEINVDSANLELAQRLDFVTNFIVIDDSYGYNAIAVGPYAAITQSYVLFADSDNIDDIEDFLDSRDVDSLIIYGNVDREVRSTLSKYDPEVINKEGDRFLNNIEIVKKYMEVKQTKQVALTNGEFIEKELLSGSEPVIFIGTNNVPPAVQDYVRESDIEVGVLIGNELVGTATFIRRQMGISVFVKFAQGARAPRGAISQVEALDMFYLPTYNLNLEIESLKYNIATNKLEVTLRNTEDQAVYFIGTYSLTDSEGTRQTVGDVGAVFIDGGELKTMTYDVEPMAEGDIAGDIFIIYGESQGSLEREIRDSLVVETVRVLDECQVQINGLEFNKRNKQFYVEVENIGTVDCYADVELVDLVIAGDRGTYALDDVLSLGAGKKKNARIKVEDFEEEDYEDNEEIKVRAYYGERETVLINVIEGRFALLFGGTDYLSYSLIIIILVLILLIIWKRRKRKEERRKS